MDGNKNGRVCQQISLNKQDVRYQKWHGGFASKTQCVIRMDLRKCGRMCSKCDGDHDVSTGAECGVQG